MIMASITTAVVVMMIIQLNPSIVTTLGKWNFGDYREVITIEGFFLLCLYINGKVKKSDYKGIWL